MTQLTVFVSGSVKESRVLTLPIDVYASDGSLVARGTASPEMAAHLEIPERVGPKLERVYVVGKLPNGSSLQESVQLRGAFANVTLELGGASPRKWLEWVTPFHNLDHLQSHDKPREITNRRIGKVWMTLWSLHGGRWGSQALQPLQHQRDQGMQQIVLNVPRVPHLLQIGGEEVAWRLVSLPPGGPVRVALTRSDADEGDTVDITVGRAIPDNELIMSYLTRGAVADVNRLAEVWNASDILLYAKKDDPVSAAAGAYVLLKSRRLHKRRDWISNLVNWFPYMADGAIVAAALALQQKNDSESKVRKLIDLALDRGLPIFAIGAPILVETMAAVHRGKNETKRFHEGYLAAQAYARALCSKGAYFAFYGKSPAQPSWTPIYGLDGSATDRPSSLGDNNNTVFFARPAGSVRVGKFGATRVALPLAPVNANIVRELEGRQIANTADGSLILENKSRGEAPLFKRTVQQGLNKLETSFLQEFAGPLARNAQQVSYRDAAPPPFLQESGASGADKPRAPRRQTSKYWQDERQSHAITIFDGEE